MSLRPVDPSPPSLNYSFSERIVGVLTLAKEEAARVGMDYVAPEHALLGLLQMHEATGFVVLKGLGVDLVEINGRVRQTIQDQEPIRGESEEIYYTSELKELLEFALAEARLLDSTYVGTEHLLLGFLHQEDTIPYQALRDAGVSLEKARAKTKEVWDSEEGFP